MNDFSELEKELGNLRPAQPSSDLIVRIARALSDDARSTSTAGVLPPKHRFDLNWLSVGLGLGAATALVLFAFVRLQQPAQKSSALGSASPAATSLNSNAQLVPAGLTQVVYHTRDEGLRFPGNSSEPMRRVRSHSRETLQWRNPKTGASLRISYPREEVSLVPVTGQ